MALRKLKAFLGIKLSELFRRRKKVKDTKNLRPVLLEIAKWLAERFDEHFDKQGVGPRGGAGIWKARRPGQFHNGKKLPTRPVLERSGKMRKGMKFTVSNGQIKFSFRESYWTFHQYGKGRMKRPIFVMTPYYKRVVADTITHYRATGEVKIIDKR